MRRAVILLALLMVVSTAGAALSAWMESASVGTNSFTTKADWEAPTVASSVIAKTVGYSAGYIKLGGSYYVYATVNDGGNPPSGVSTATADVSAITLGQTAVLLASGSFSVGGATYNRRSPSLTAAAVLPAGTYTYTIRSEDASGSSRTQTGFSVVVDNTVPAASDVQTANGSTTVGRAELGDTITYTYSEPVDPNSILAGWTGASTNVVVRLNQATASDTVTIFNSANASQLPLGTVTLNRTDYTSSNRTFGATGTRSTMVMSGSSITITLGTASGTVTTAASTGNMSWAPSATAQDRAGNACSATAITETGTADQDF